MAFELHGTRGSVSWNFERMNELNVYIPQDDSIHDGPVQLYAAPEHPGYADFYPGPALGMSYDDLGQVEYLPFAESVDLMKNRQLDATLQSAGLGVASLKDLSTSIPITVVSVPADVAEKLGAPYVAENIPANTYDGQNEAVPTVAVINFLVSSSNVSDDLAYQMTKLLYENLDELKAAHAATASIDVQNALKGMPIPVHPGAQKYYDEVGVKAE